MLKMKNRINGIETALVSWWHHKIAPKTLDVNNAFFGVDTTEHLKLLHRDSATTCNLLLIPQEKLLNLFASREPNL